MSCTCCQAQLNSGMVQKKDANTGEKYKSCPHCTEANGSEHVFHRYPSDFGNTPARITAKNPNGHQSYCKECRGLARGVASNAYIRGVLCSSLV
ncbi:hypothetical protein [Shewanella baltica]|uniref:hypothetical protein n=1 Tax=Shewanella baltica TaxID=62322 RepID=UPI00217CD2E5|nr:hypothetical protein [Shewanella baltica]MCS6124834.1 hypothetical protein [Shewanella baltica]